MPAKAAGLCILAAAVLLIAAPAHAFERTDAEKTQCLAIARVLEESNGYSSVEWDKETYARDPTPENKQRLDDDTAYEADERATFTALYALYSGAAEPSDDMIAPLRQVPGGQLVARGKACLEPQ